MKQGIKIAKNKDEIKKIFKIRENVFGKEQKVPRKIDFDELDKIPIQIIVNYNDKTIGCARIRFNKNKAKLERIAILKKYRRRGFGRKLMQYLINYCKRKKMREVYLHSQYYIKGFYENLGFKIRGKLFKEAKIKHIEMYKTLK